VYNDEAKTAIELELAQAEHAREEGFEGRARVCARRAVGIAIREYARIHQISITSTNAYDLLSFLKKSSNFSPEIKEVADHLLTRVNEEFKLPSGMDLLSEARWLVETLQSDSI
jgi:HEPN domain-containing protein